MRSKNPIKPSHTYITPEKILKKLDPIMISSRSGWRIIEIKMMMDVTWTNLSKLICSLSQGSNTPLMAWSHSIEKARRPKNGNKLGNKSVPGVQVVLLNRTHKG